MNANSAILLNFKQRKILMREFETRLSAGICEQKWLQMLLDNSVAV